MRRRSPAHAHAVTFVRLGAESVVTTHHTNSYLREHATDSFIAWRHQRPRGHLLKHIKQNTLFNANEPPTTDGSSYYLQGGPKRSTPTELLTNGIISYLSLPMILYFFVKLKYQRNTMILSVGIQCSMRELISNVN